jgi:ubiquinone biosynthesis protein
LPNWKTLKNKGDKKIKPLPIQQWLFIMKETKIMANRNPAPAPDRKAASKKTSRLIEIILVLRKNDIIHGITPVKLKKILEELGPTFIKIGQIMSMRSDILPQQYCDELINLRTNVTPMDFSEIERVIASEYGVSYKKLFGSIDANPLGSASIAQVHRAVLKDGQKVVIKVQRLHIREIMAKDIAMIRKAISLMKIINRTGEAIDFKTIVEEMWIVAQQEMDFLIEASHLEEFARLNSDIKYIVCPKVEKSLTTSRVLVMEYVEGVQIDDLKTLRELGYDSNEIGRKLAENYAKQVLDDAFFHADPHPGNIRIRDGKIVWLDLGMMGRLNHRDQQLIKSTVKAIIKNDTFELKNAILTIGVVKGKINHTALYTDIDEMLGRYRQIDLASIHLGNFFSELAAIANRHSLSMPKGFSMLGRGILTIEGVLAFCSPQLNFVQIIADHMFGSMIKDFDTSKEFKQTMERLLNTLNKSVDIPSGIADVLKMTAKGQTKINLELIEAAEPLHAVNKMVDKLVIGIIDAALLISSSLICTINITPKIFEIPLLGVLGYFSAVVLGVWLLYGIIRMKK